MRNYLISILALGTFIVSGKGFASDCVPAPDCASLGYNKNAIDCTGSFLKCPWDLTKAACETCNVANCKTCVSGSSNLCQECESGYTGLHDIASGHMTECTKVNLVCGVANCQICVSGNANKCSTCKPGYSLTSTGTCTSVTPAYDCASKYTYYNNINEKLQTTLLRNSCKGYISWNSGQFMISMGETCDAFNTRISKEIALHNNQCPANYQIKSVNSARCNACCDGGLGGYGSIYMCSDNGGNDGMIM